MLPQIRLPSEQLAASLAGEPTRVGSLRFTPFDSARDAGLVPATVRCQVRGAVEYLNQNGEKLLLGDRT